MKPISKRTGQDAAARDSEGAGSARSGDSLGNTSRGVWLQTLLERNRRQEPVGNYSVCSANVRVLEAAMRQALADQSALCIESTSNQVNQFGGYTGLTPAQFKIFVGSIARRVGFPEQRILLGSDHLGPFPWRHEASGTALAKACELVRDSVLAGYTKIHLDASMACADDAVNQPLDADVIALRAAAIGQVAERTWAALPAGSPALLYVIGTEVPAPGGEQERERRVEVKNRRYDHATRRQDHDRPQNDHDLCDIGKSGTRPCLPPRTSSRARSSQARKL